MDNNRYWHLIFFTFFSSRSNGQLRQTLNKAKTLCDRWRPHSLKDPPPGHDGQPPGRLSRWFSMRRGSSNQYELDNGQDRFSVGGKMPLLSEVCSSYKKMN